MKAVIGVVLLGVVLPALSKECAQLYEENGLSPNFNETIAHAIHSLTLNELRKFNPLAEELNGVPVVNPRLNDPTETERVIPHAPEEEINKNFVSEAMNTIDSVMSQVGQSGDQFGTNWPLVARIVHKFHMKDTWAKIKEEFDLMKQPSKDLCVCLKDTKKNGIFQAVDWVARQYRTAPLFTLLNKPLPKLKDAKSWEVWRARLVQYYDSQAITDAATYLSCVLNHTG
ncbi:hypothetical protein EB796_009138 [Bugula neritina]|uniref:Uncharacterized protein n=1 Tax=Bugula neritina TaxID=10212 RepID=A0A7J7K2U6_BUGNE|nr:hypothetical protein EB796_009138 [Bugula neritina]